MKKNLCTDVIEADNIGLSKSTNIQKPDQQSNGSHVYLAYHNGECMITRKSFFKNRKKKALDLVFA